MAEKLLIDAHYNEETRIAIIDEDGKLTNFETESFDKKQIKGNVYIAKVARIEPSLQAAFIDYGSDKNGFLPFSEILPSYFNIKNSNDQDAKNYKIQDVIKQNQTFVVQAIREKRGNKCAAFSTYISLPARYCVLVSNTNGKSGGISKKINDSDKERLREIVSELSVPEGMGIIIRTAGENRKKQEIKRDFDYLVRLWNDIKSKGESIKVPSLISEEGNIIKRTIRDLYKRTMDGIIVSGSSAYKEARTFMKMFTPSHVRKIELYKEEDIPLFHKYNVEEKIKSMFDTTVYLPSGGSIVINTTEALTAIDVNSGKTKQEKDIDTTALRTNLEAAAEIVRQMKLRDVGGLIVIDFIDMTEQNSVLKVEKKFKDCVKEDYSNIQVGRISQFGLLELSRQRQRPSLSDSTFIVCPHCCGSGKILSDETTGMSVLRQIEGYVISENAKSVIAEVASGVDLFILNSKRRLLIDIEEKYGVSIEILRNNALKSFECSIIVKEFKEKQEEDVKITHPRVVEKNTSEVLEDKPLRKKEVVVEKAEENTESKPIVKRRKIKNKKRPDNLIIEEKEVKNTNEKEIEQAVVEEGSSNLETISSTPRLVKKKRRNKRKKYTNEVIASIAQSDSSTVEKKEEVKEVVSLPVENDGNTENVNSNPVKRKKRRRPKKTETKEPENSSYVREVPDNAKKVVFEENESPQKEVVLESKPKNPSVKRRKKNGWLKKIFS